jgi:hypothetical protein
MTAEEYRQRMIQAFHNADTDELIAVCVLPTEKEFEHLEWLLKNHYKKEPCDDAVSRQAVIDMIEGFIADATSHGISPRLDPYYVMNGIKGLPSVTVRQTEAYIDGIHAMGYREGYKDAQKQKCPNCGAKMQESEEQTDAT